MNKVMVNCETGESEVVPLTAEEIAQMETDGQAFAQEQAEMEAARIAREEAQAAAIAKLTNLGLTEDEAKALIG